MFYRRLKQTEVLMTCGFDAVVTATPSLPRVGPDFNPQRQKFNGQKVRKFYLRNSPLVLLFAPPIPAFLVDQEMSAMQAPRIPRVAVRHPDCQPGRPGTYP